MLTYIPPLERDPLPAGAEKPWLLLLLCLVWLIPGLIGHDPWKPDEVETAAVIQQFMQGAYWSVPQFAGQPYLEHAPLYYWAAALFAWPLQKLGMAVHDAARITTGIWMALALWGLGLAGRELYGRRYGRVAVITLIGCIGLIIWGHHLSPQVLSFAAFSWHIYGLAYALRQPLRAGFVLGLAWLLLLLGGNWAEFTLALSSALLLFLFKPWRSSSFCVSLLCALVIALPLGAIWPIDLYQHARPVFDLWLGQYALGPFGGFTQFNAFHAFGFFFSIALWFAWPALPLAIWGLWANRHQLTEPKIVLPSVLLLLHIMWFVVAGDARESHALIVLLPLSILAASGVDDLRRGAAQALNWFGLMTFGLFTGLLWLGWLAVHTGVPTGMARTLREASPAYQAEWNTVGIAFALGLTVIWCIVIARKRPPGRLAVTNWACGVTLIWGVLISLWQPWLDAQKSYRGVSYSLRDAMQEQKGCIDGRNIPSAPLASFEYFAGITLQQGIKAEACRLRMVAGGEPLGSTVLWRGNRAGEHKESFSLIRIQ
jgi:4-amino-4-deoxy-L-arabinose transferase-like glycosyltransferase